ncbi:PREDICTED: uncharacterized protein LOC108776441 [Cyphomyrmex costatus]|uniref:uncharacterized protein LOC108776441 n=1 Tax=Cyphomyrmex costatus TaxID=456900 RepID=UPI0008521DB8|nr:PREDICTED: uncharacterized protein LOC108776441 [Cyphomyrmex costatus]
MDRVVDDIQVMDPDDVGMIVDEVLEDVNFEDLMEVESSDESVLSDDTGCISDLENNTDYASQWTRIVVKDLYTLPYESFLYIKGKLTKNVVVPNADVALGNNCLAFMFDEIRYELDGVEIDRNRNVGVTSTIKNYVTVTSDRSVILRNAGWDAQTTADGYFNFCVPLNVLLEFCEDYRRVVQNQRSSRVDSDTSAQRRELSGGKFSVGTEARTVQDTMANAARGAERREQAATTKHSWAIKTAQPSQLEKPRYVIFAMQTDRKKMSEDTSQFDNCKLSNVKLYLNSECYPYDDLNLDFDRNRWAILYDMYARFCKGYYGYEYLEPNLTVSSFKRMGPFVIIDCSRQNESVKSATVDVRMDFELKENAPANTTAYCLIIHDRVVEYNPLTSVVRKIT